MVLLVIAVRFIFQVILFKAQFFHANDPSHRLKIGLLTIFCPAVSGSLGKNNLFEAKRSMEIDKRKVESTDSRK